MADATQLSLYLADALSGLGPVRSKRFFGGTALTIDGVQFAFIMGEALYLRVDEESRKLFEAAGSAPFRYDTRAKTIAVTSYYAAPPDILDEAEELRRWAKRAYTAALQAKRTGRGRASRRQAGPSA